MRCSKCGSPDHNVRTCPYRDQDVPRNRALWVKVDNLTVREEADLLSGIVKLKKKVAPKGRATSANGDVKELPGRIRDALKLLGGN